MPVNNELSRPLIKLLFAVLCKAGYYKTRDLARIRTLCMEPELFLFIKHCLELNSHLDEASRSWIHSDGQIQEILAAYRKLLTHVGFSAQEQRELLPNNAIFPQVISLKELSIIRPGVRYALLDTNAKEDYIKKLKNSNVPEDIIQLLVDSKYVIKLLKQCYFNLPPGARSGFMSQLGLETPSTFSVQVYKYLSEKAPIPRDNSDCGRILEFLLQAIYSPNVDFSHRLNESGWNLAHYASKYAPLLLLRSLHREHKINFATTMTNNITCLQLAIIEQSSNVRFIIDQLKDQPAVINHKDSIHGHTALIYAINVNNLALVEALIAVGASVNVQDMRGDTPLHYAVKNRLSHSPDKLSEVRMAIITLLLTQPTIQPELRNATGLTAYEVAVAKGCSSRKVFMQYYKQQRAKGVFFYDKQPNLANLLLTLINSGKGLVCLEEYAIRSPRQLAALRDDQNRDIATLIYSLRLNQPIAILRRQLLIVANHCPELIKHRDIFYFLLTNRSEELDLEEYQHLLSANHPLAQLANEIKYVDFSINAIAALSLAIIPLGAMSGLSANTLCVMLLIIGIGLVPAVTQARLQVEPLVTLAILTSASLSKLLALVKSEHSRDLQAENRSSAEDIRSSRQNSNPQQALAPTFTNPAGMEFRRRKVTEQNAASAKEEVADQSSLARSPSV